MTMNPVGHTEYLLPVSNRRIRCLLDQFKVDYFAILFYP